jgi:hypothetical protein
MDDFNILITHKTIDNYINNILTKDYFNLTKLNFSDYIKYNDILNVVIDADNSDYSLEEAEKYKEPVNIKETLSFNKETGEYE